MAIDLERPLVLVGAGKMGGALLSGWLDGGVAPGLVAIRDPHLPDEVAALAKERGVRLDASIDDLAALKPAAVVLAVKPQAMPEVLPALRPLVAPETLFVSIAAGVGAGRLDELLGGGAAIVRAMPNTPASVGRGISGAFANPCVSEAQKALADGLLAAVGDAVWIEDEALMDAVTAISGSGPAYVFHMVEAMAGAGVALGLPEDTAMRLARATVSGAGEMLYRSDLDAGTLRRNVTSPGGTTAAALDVLMGGDALSELMKKAALAARDRGRELGK
ncbi:pyrroline-5-carboxylate reductase [Parvibaculum indicum]|uniref:pyrroline-5-carboxylate reductase n=1 Tax=Parvibaculum indicum TaxID=562969 RepID=UPI001424344E|nr:pyrroline-5-carboxylate reductase [Parvibaculum indicum]NIJ40250.1 pyrroline-5-carboxylate reductase [Parvibaculum indicum]